jgi:hypothetical protein
MFAGASGFAVSPDVDEEVAFAVTAVVVVAAKALVHTVPAISIAETAI